MCGIIGYVGSRPAAGLVLDGLERLEYRGYDSAGLCVASNGSLEVVRAVGALSNLRTALERNYPMPATTGIGHTRWATHGRVRIENAHPLPGLPEGAVAVVLNGIVENYRTLRRELEDDGHHFASDTDAETVVHLVERHYEGDLAAAVAEAERRLQGHFAFVVIHRDQPDVLVATRRQCPLVIGVGDDEIFLASSVAAFLEQTRRIVLVDDGETVVAQATGARVVRAGAEQRRPVHSIDWDQGTAERGGYESFMLKEIHEQPLTLADTLAGRIVDGRADMSEARLDTPALQALDAITIVGCGTAYHAGVVARYMIETWGRLPVAHEIASEWRYREPIVSPSSLVIGISQSGETADTLAALRLARRAGARTLAVTNMPGSQITREVDDVLFTRCGIEMGVAATKTFTAQVGVLATLALAIAEARHTLPGDRLDLLAAELDGLPVLLERRLRDDDDIVDIARRYGHERFFLYLGRHVGLPVALEGALKLKEISYVPTDAYAAGEMKHGPIALLDEATPVVCVATDSHVYDKLVSNVQETRARGARVIAIASDGNEDVHHHADDVVYVPRTDPLLAPLVAVVPLQLLAYRIARLRGLDVDRPRNLAKTVTVE